MKKLLMIGLVVLLSAGVAVAKDFEVKKKAGDYDVTVTIDKNPPVTGDNGVTVEIKDAAGHHVRDAKVIVDYSMPAMPGMPPMNYKTDAELKGSAYKATMNLSMSGPWSISIKVTKAGKTSTARFNIDAR